jgi:hypothetical protein
MAIVYKHYRLDNNQLFYVGIGKKESRAYSSKSRNNYWHNIVSKYGYYVEIYKKDIEYKEAMQIEISLIKEYGRADLGEGQLVNMTNGGDGHHCFSEQTKQKIKNSLTNRKQSEETKNKRAETLRNLYKNNPDLVELKRNQSIELNKLGLIGTKGKPSKKKGLPFTGDKKQLSNSLKKYYETNKPINYKYFSDEELNLIKNDFSNGMKLATVSKKYKINRKVLERLILEHNINVTTSIKISKEKLYDMYIEQNLKRKEISKILNCSIGNIEKLLKKNNIKKCLHSSN